MKNSHNKKRNTKFIFESLVIEMTKYIMKGEKQKGKEILSLIKESFGKDTNLYKELKIYDSFLSTEKVACRIAEKIIDELKKEHKDTINKEELFKEQSVLIAKVNKRNFKNAFSNFVPNYRNLATIYQILGKELNAKKRIMLEEKMIDFMSKADRIDEKKVEHINSLTYKIFLEKFNNEYSSLNENQKKLIYNFIMSFSDDEVSFNEFLNEEIERIKSELEKGRRKDIEIFTNEEINMKLGKVYSLIESFKEKKVGEKEVVKILQLQELCKEINL